MVRKVSKKERVLRQKPSHVIDASVLFGLWDEKNKENKEVCEKYLGAIAHKYKGFASIPIIGEVFLAINKIKDEEFRYGVLTYLNKLLDRCALNIIPVKIDRDAYARELIDINYKIDEDDATHLSNTIASKHNFFITLDSTLVGEGTEVSRQMIKERLGLEIIHPIDVIENLGI